MPSRVRAALDAAGGPSSISARFALPVDADLLGCPLCGHPPGAASERETAAGQACPACPSATSTASIGYTLYVSAASSGGSGASPDTPMSIDQLRSIVQQERTYPGLTILFDASAPFEITTSVGTSPTGPFGGHVVDPVAESPCWSPWSGTATAPEAFLVVRCSGTEGRPLRIGSYLPGDLDPLPISLVAAAAGTFVGSSSPGGSSPPPAIDFDALIPAPSGRARIDGGRWCWDTAPEDASGHALELPDYPTHSVINGILFENACWIEITDLELTGFTSGIRVHGHCWNLLFADLHLHNNARHGLVARACPELWGRNEPCVEERTAADGSTVEYAETDDDGETVLSTAPAWLEEARGYPSNIEITRCLFEDNGWGGTSAFAQLNPVEYCTNFHIHHNLFCMTAYGCAWEQFPPAPTLSLTDDEVPDDTGDIEAFAPCSADEDCDCEEATRALQELKRACCGPLADPDATDACAFGAQGLGSASDFCACDPQNEASDCSRAALQLKLARGFRADPYALEDPRCLRRSGDGITFHRCSSGHLVEDNTFIGMNKNCGAFPRPGIGCTDTSDGDGIDMKGARKRTPNADSELTVIRHNLFLFNEGAGVQMIDGTQGVEIYRNVFAGNGRGIKLATGDNVEFFGEWTCEDSDTDPLDGDAEVTLEWLETGCVRIYRNLFYANDRLDTRCSGQGTGAGPAILVDAEAALGFGKPKAAAGDDTEYYAGTLHATRVRDVWIVNNTIDSNPGGGITITRPIDCVVDHERMAYLPVASGADCQDPDEWLPALVRVTGVHVLNNLVTDNNTWSNTSTCLQAVMGNGQTQWVGQAADPAGIRTHEDWHPEDDEKRIFEEDFEVDGNIWVQPDPANDPQVIRYSFDQPRWDELVSTHGHEGWWDGQQWLWGGETISASGKDFKYFYERWLQVGYRGITSGSWDWLEDSGLGYAFEEDWGPVELAWDTLPPEWNPEAFRPSTASIAAIGAAESGIADHGVWSGRCSPPPAFDDGSGLVDVAFSTDLLCTASASPAAGPHIGALSPDWPLPATPARLDEGVVPRRPALGTAFGRLVW